MASTRLYSEALQKFQQDVLDRHKDSRTSRLLDDFLLDGKSKLSTPGAAKASARQLSTDAGLKYGQVKIGRVEVVPKKWIENILGNIDSIIAAGGAIIQDAPQSVGLAWFAITLTLKAIRNNYSLYALFGKGLTDVTEVMVIVVHYDRLFDERQEPGFKLTDLADKLFRDTVSAYVAVLDFCFSVKKHMSGKAMDKLKHSFQDFLDLNAVKFQGKLSLIADLKNQILESSRGVFEDRTLQQFGNVRAAIEQVDRHQSQVLELQRGQNQMLALMHGNLQGIKDLKPKTPWEYLKEEFVTNKQKLSPLSDPQQEINSLQTRRHPNTCKWILSDDRYRSWEESAESAILCIDGGPGSGKSTLLASIIQHLETSMDTESHFINFVSCLPSDSTKPLAFKRQKLSRVCNTLLYQSYELAAGDYGSFYMLEMCNQIFRNPKSHGNRPKSGRETQDDSLPDFIGAMRELIVTLKRDTVLIIDAVGALSTEDQEQLYNSLQELVSHPPKSQKLSVLVGGRYDDIFVQYALAHDLCIDVSKENRADMEIVLDSRLRNFCEWSYAETKEAKEHVMDRAGSMFSYIDDVAIPFLQQPFRRPISRHLSNLPAGMNESFERALHSMQQNYFDLLQLSVTWCLLSPRAVTVKEVIEAYSGIYSIQEENNGLASASDDGTYNSAASPLEVQQIHRASGPFLCTESIGDGHTLVKLQNVRQVQEFCERSNEIPRVKHSDRVPLCGNCRSTITAASTLTIDAKAVHLEIALKQLKHLNNPLFQRRFGLLQGIANSDSVEDASIDANREVNKSSSLDGREFKSTVASMNIEIAGEASKQCLMNGRASEIQDTEADHEIDVQDATSASREEGEVVSPDLDVNNDDDDDDDDDDDSEDADNHTEASQDPEFDQLDIVKDGSEDNDSEIPEFSLYDRNPELRSEINNWPYHLQEAEKLWLPHERTNNEVWTRLNRGIQKELENFVNNQEVFHNWQRIWGCNRVFAMKNGPVTPLYLATCLGLRTWVESLLSNGANVHELSWGRNVLQASSDFASVHHDVELLRTLLARGADPYQAEVESNQCALNAWLAKCNSFAVVKALVDHEVRFDHGDRKGWTGMHAFACTGKDTESFNLIMNPTNPALRPNINIKDHWGETPLHRLLYRRDVPLDLLKAFLAVKGIEINEGDRYSQKPLGVASLWGSLGVVSALLAANADLEGKDKKGYRALHVAAQGDHVRCIQALLDAHAELEPQDHLGSKPLHHAAFCGREAAVKLLLSRRSDLNSTNKRNHTPFFNATRCLFGGPETAQFLLTKLREGGYSASAINTITTGGRTPLRQLADHGFADLLQQLLEIIDASDDEDVRATINQGDELRRRTPLHCTARRGHVKCVKLLIDHGALVSLVDSGGQTPLTLAQEQWAYRNTSAFEQVVCDLIGQDPQNATADAELFSIAAANGSMRVVRQLHDLGADATRTDSFGWSPLAHVKQSGCKEVEDYLKHETGWGGTLPSKWVNKSSVVVLDNEGLRLTHHTDQRLCVSSDKPLPPDIERFYFEITLVSLQPRFEVAIGFCTLGASAHRFPGWEPRDTAPSATAWGYHGDDGGLFHQGDSCVYQSESYGAGDTVGCGVDVGTRKIWFTKNGVKLDYEFEGVKGRLFPVVGLMDPVVLTTNFGRQAYEWKDQQLSGEG